MKQQLVGLVCAGPVSRSSIATDHHVLDRLGPVKAASLRVASRAVNTMRAGTPVNTYEDLAGARLILISAPDDELAGIVNGFSKAGLRWNSHVVALVDSEYDSAALQPFAKAGASTASFNSFGRLLPEKYLLEGDARAVRTIQKLFSHADMRAIVIRVGSKSQLLAAIQLMELAIMSTFAAGSEGLHEIGVGSQDCNAILESCARESVRSYLRSGRGALANLTFGLTEQHLSFVESQNAKLAEFYRQVLKSGRVLRSDVPVTG